MPPRRLQRLARLDPARWSQRAQTTTLFFPALAALLCLAAAPLFPEGIVYTHAAKAAALTLPRWAMALWLPWGLALGTRARGLLPAALVLGLFGLVLAGDPILPGPGVGYKILSTNVNAYSDDPDPGHLSAAVAALTPDVVVAVERRLLAVPGMTRVADDLDADLPRQSHAITVFCREGVPCEAEVTPEFGSATMKMPMAIVRLGQSLCYLGIHAPPPVPFDTTGIGPYVALVASLVDQGRMVQSWGPCRAGDPVAMAGDLNGVPFSTAWYTLRGRGLRPVLLSAGIYAASWPAGGGWPDFPLFELDHLFAGDLEVSGARTVRIPGTDHKGILWWVRGVASDQTPSWIL